MSDQQPKAARSVAAWGLGWASALVAVAVMFSPPELASRSGHLTMGGVVGALAFGLPTYVSGRIRGSRAPLAEALVWTGGVLIAAALLSTVMTAWHTAMPGEVNAVTTEGIRARREYMRTGPHLPREAVLALQVVTGFGLVAGFVSGLIGGAGVTRAVGLSLMSATAVLVGLVALVVVGPIVVTLLDRGARVLEYTPVGGPVALGAAGLAAGCAVGAVIEAARWILFRHE